MSIGTKLRAVAGVLAGGLAIALAPAAPAVAADGLRPGAEAGYTTLAPIDYDFTVRRSGRKDQVVDFTTTEARVFTSFQPADVNPAGAPLFVMLNGGPGAATTANLFANNTAPYTINLQRVDKDPAGVVPNPDSWTQAGNLLYIDPPMTGFSYNVSKQVFGSPKYTSILSQLWKEYWDRGNFNPFIDADQVLRVVLMFLDSHPVYRDAPVVLVGESYGGTRVSLMLHLLLNSASYDTGGSAFFHDAGLAQMIRKHFGVSKAPAPAVVTGQFTRQILIQPQLSSYQGDVQGQMYWNGKRPTIIDEVAAESGHKGGYTRSVDYCRKHWPFLLDRNQCTIMEYVPAWGRDRYDYAMPADYSDKQDAYANVAMRNVPILTTMLGVDPATIGGLQPSSRQYAYHTMGYPVVGPDERSNGDQNTLVGRFGTLNAPDNYYMSWSDAIYLASTKNLGSWVRDNLPLSVDQDHIYGDIFLQNLRYVPAFLTNAARDLVIYSPALPVALSKHKAVEKAVVVPAGMPDAAGAVDVTYTDGAIARITYPFYREAGHAVAATAAGALLGDVREWMALPVEPLDPGPFQDRLSLALHPTWRSSLTRLRVDVTAASPARSQHAGTVLLPARRHPAGVIRTRGGIRLRHKGRAAAITRLVVHLKSRRVDATVTGAGKVRGLLRLRSVRTGSDPKMRLVAGRVRPLNKALGVRAVRPGRTLARLAFTPR